MEEIFCEKRYKGNKGMTYPKWSHYQPSILLAYLKSIKGCYYVYFCFFSTFYILYLEINTQGVLG